MNILLMYSSKTVTLGIDPATVNPTLTLEELTHKVAKESSLEVQIVTGNFFDLFV